MLSVRNIVVIFLLSQILTISCSTDISDQGQLIFAHVVSEPSTFRFSHNVISTMTFSMPINYKLLSCFFIDRFSGMVIGRQLIPIPPIHTRTAITGTFFYGSPT